MHIEAEEMRSSMWIVFFREECDLIFTRVLGDESEICEFFIHRHSHDCLICCERYSWFESFFRYYLDTLYHSIDCFLTSRLNGSYRECSSHIARISHIFRTRIDEDEITLCELSRMNTIVEDTGIRT